MKIENNFLKNNNVKYIKSPNFNKKFIPKELKYIIMHFTGGTSLNGAIETFSNKETKVSAHLIIDTNGDIIQMVPFDYTAWHAGNSEWNNLKYMNKYSIGIEFVNVGKLEKKENVYIDAWNHKFYDTEKIFHHKETNTYWQKFPVIQIEKGLEITKLLIHEYKIIDILGHNDISPGRKLDPGPAFPMNKFKELLTL